MHQLWTQKYSPQKISDIPQSVAVELKEFVTNFKQKKKKSLLLYGPPGTGKSTTVHALARELDAELIEVNASDFRTSDALQTTIGNASQQQSLFGTQKIILIDEIDGISGTKDRGGLPALANIISETNFPIIMTANDPWNSKFSTIRNKSNLLEFPELDTASIFTVLQKICQAESILYDELTLKTLARRAGGDLRAAINDLQAITPDSKLSPQKLEQDITRNKIDSMLNALVKILKSTDITTALTAFDTIEEDINQCLLWLDENIPKEYTAPHDLARAYDALSKADVFLGRIRRRQHWRLLVYANTLITAGVAVAKAEKNKNVVKYTPSMRPLKIWQANKKYAGRNSLTEKLAIITHCSRRKTLKTTLPLVQNAYKTSHAFAQHFRQELELEEEELAWLHITEERSIYRK